MRLACVLDDGDAGGVGDGHDRLDVADAAEQVDRHDGPRRRRQGRPHRVRSDDPVVVAVDQHRPGAHRQDGAGAGNERIGLGDDLVARSDAERPQGQLQGRQPGVDPDRMWDAAVGGEFLLEELDVFAEDEVPAAQHRLDRLVESRLEGLDLGLEVDEADRAVERRAHPVLSRYERECVN